VFSGKIAEFSPIFVGNVRMVVMILMKNFGQNWATSELGSGVRFRRHSPIGILMHVDICVVCLCSVVVGCDLCLLILIVSNSTDQ